MLEVVNAKLMYGDFTAVDGLSFSVKKGEIFGLLGANGAGKTTTFRMIMGLLQPTEGYVKYDDKYVSYETVDKIGYMIEERSLLTKMTVKNLMLYYGQLKNVSKEDILKRLDMWLNRFGIAKYKDKKIKELSKGNQQKIQFISALINEPTLLVLDEPFSGLDVINVEQFVEVIKEFKDKGATIIFSSHQIDHVESFCEQLLVLQKGKPILEGQIKNIKKEYKKHNIKVVGDVDVSKLLKIKGVYDVVSNSNEYIVKIEGFEYTQSVFDYVATCKNVTKFIVEEASLAEIFIAKVGNSYEEI
ncbi:ABC-type transport system, ATPase component [Alteracholeplasma palmae J233]|uniref:ABC-type transport system, ATPase component n=1 Tax=Alteracholeplasma palmae (strain ATCC 49389 / J233) TaxID=1318466 RepID=U4KKG7_ALTPJ|nr:ATP-binding cassette domain-containing protein [Alteracholeplasma palmae]CCV64063.1 ABC-type transport system, ATPase component [Alteracholeplasma palmae J233]